MGVEPVGLPDGFLDELCGHLKADVLQICSGSKATLTHLVDVEGKFRADMLPFAFSVVDDWAVFFFEIGEFDWNRLVDGSGMSYVVADVVRECSDGKGQLVGILRVSQKAGDEVSGADVVSKIAEERVAEGVVPEVLYDTAAVGVGMCFTKLGLSEMRVVAKQDGTDGLFPGDVNQLLMGEYGVRPALYGDEEKCNQRQGPEKEVVACPVDGSSSCVS